jgi:hypothetical protein
LWYFGRPRDHFGSEDQGDEPQAGLRHIEPFPDSTLLESAHKHELRELRLGTDPISPVGGGSLSSTFSLRIYTASA